MKKILLILVSLIHCSQFQSFAHGGGDVHTTTATISDQVTSQLHGHQLSLRLVPQSALESQSSAQALAQLATTAAKSPEGEPYQARVGDLAFLIAELSQAGKPVKDVRFKMKFHHLEDDKEIFAVALISADGKMNWGQQFFDGAEHSITLIAEPVEAGAFEPITVEMTIAVIPIQPPASVIIRSLILLLSITALAMMIGYILSFLLRKNKLSQKNSSDLRGAVVDAGKC
ncbi:MAG: hypothetical protein L3J39_06730 [Verrucomicrobiales bacterium]|nr:hypothetical protein [Verrucomicrobiales bacterium]